MHPRTKLPRVPRWLIPPLAAAALLAACAGDPASPTTEQEPQGEPDVTPPVADLIVRYIQRLPEMNWVPYSADPTREGWPTEGQEVTWSAHVLNRMPNAHDSVGYRWLLDGEEVAAGTVDLPAGGEVTVQLPWTWTFDRHRLAFEIDPDDAVDEEGRNNRLEVFTDALSVGFWVEQTVYDLAAQTQPALGIGSTSFDDFANRQIRYFNEMFEEAVYPETPDGVLDRLRVDKIVVVPDSSLPLVDIGYTGFDQGEATPDASDSTVDLMWGFPVYVQSMFDAGSSQSDYSGFVQHEMGHARYLIDVNALNVFQGTAGDSIGILEDGEPVAGSVYMPGTTVNFNGKTGLEVYETQRGLMNAQWDFLDRHSAGALNRIAGHRAVAGSWNDPENTGEYLNDLPVQNRLLVADFYGRPLPAASVDVYRSERGDVVDSLSGYYKKYYDNTPDMVLTADSAGYVLLGRDPFGGIHQDMEFTNGTLIIRVEHDGAVGYGFLDVTGFNQAYWRGETDLADDTLRVVMHRP
jgi:hypothetical protein